MVETRRALVRNGETEERIAAYLPANYEVVGRAYLMDGPASIKPDVCFLIEGVDDHGWSLHEYVIPRLASGLIWAEEVFGTGVVH